MLDVSTEEGWENNQYLEIEVLPWDLLAFCFAHLYKHVPDLTIESRLEKKSFSDYEIYIYIYMYHVAFGIILM